MLIEARRVVIAGDDYYANTCISQSMVTRVINNKLEDWNNLWIDNPQMRMGRAFHAKTLEGKPFPKSLKSGEREHLKGCLDALMDSDEFNQIMSEARTETSYSGKIEVGGYVEDVRARTDIETDHATWDLKYAGDERSYENPSMIEKWMLHVQGGLYQHFRYKATGELKPYGLAVCHARPVYWTEFIRIPQDWLDVGLQIFFEVSEEIAKIKNLDNYADSRYFNRGVLDVLGSPRKMRIFSE